MARIWYPVIDYIACTDCGDCIERCPQGVYDSNKFPSPDVKNPNECIDHCRECSMHCPVGAISYVGDHADLAPTNGNEMEEEACYSNGSESTNKKVVVNYLYLDLQTCDRCIGTDSILDEVMLTLNPALEIAGYEVEYKKIQMDTAELAQQYRFLSSPTISVNGRDIFQAISENNCGCCSEISGTNVDCRVFESNGETFEVPTKEMLADSIFKAIFRQPTLGGSCEDYELPENLRTFYEGKLSKSGCSCGCEHC